MKAARALVVALLAGAVLVLATIIIGLPAGWLVGGKAGVQGGVAAAFVAAGGVMHWLWAWRLDAWVNGPMTAEREADEHERELLARERADRRMRER